jgi:glycine oxidase
MASQSSNPGRKGPRVAVIGAGVIGLACALELKRRGAEVAVYERGTELGAGATIRAAGMLSVAFEWGLDDENPALVRFAQQAGQLWPDFATRVERDGGGGIELSGEGAIVLARDANEVSRLERLAAACQARGLPARLVGPAELKSEEKAVTVSVRAALVLPEDRQVEPPMLLQRLAAALTRTGVSLRLGRAIGRIGVGDLFQMTDGERFDRIVLATGSGPGVIQFVGAGGRLLDTGLAAIIPVKGQMLALAPVEGAPRHVIHTRDVYIAPKSRWILVGATSERGRSDIGVDRPAIQALHEKAEAVASALGRAAELSAWAGIRPGTQDDAPMIGKTAIPGVFAALGHYRNGVLFAPATAELVADMVVGGRAGGLAAAFDPLRFHRPAN